MNLLPPSQEKALVNQRDRVRQLERKAGKDARLATHEMSVGSQYGAVAVTALADTPPDEVFIGGQLVQVVAGLATAGSANTVVTLYVNGGSVGTVTLASGETRKTAYLGDIRLKVGDIIQPVITTAGASAKGLSLKLRMKG